MPTDPFAVLGISRRSSLVEARTAYRRLALRHHPDRNPGDRAAAGRFKRVLTAYRAIASGDARRESAPDVTPAGPRPDRYGCATCGDAFPFPEACPRCGVALHDRSSGPAVSPTDPEVEAMIDELLSRPEPSPHWTDRLPIPGLLIAGCLMAAFMVWQVGPLGPSLLFVGFAAYVGLLEGHRRATEAYERSLDRPLDSPDDPAEARA